MLACLSKLSKSNASKKIEIESGLIHVLRVYLNFFPDIVYDLGELIVLF